MKPVASETAPSVKAIGKPTKMTANRTPSATMPRISLLIGAPRPPGTVADPPRGCGPAWERPGARPAACVRRPSYRDLRRRRAVGPFAAADRVDALQALARA